jgi:dipeptidyl aminopeptidase/acylaminoacyl peptidase
MTGVTSGAEKEGSPVAADGNGWRMVLSKRRGAGVLALLIIAALGAIAGRGFRNGLRAARPARRPLAPDARRQAQLQFPTLQDLAVPTTDALTIRGWYVPPRNGGVVILGTGALTNRTQLIPEAKVLVEHDFGVVLFDWRGAGASDGAYPGWGGGEQHDLRALLDDLQRRPEVSRIGVFGFSTGAMAVAMVAAQDPRIQAVALHALWPTYLEEFHYRLGKYGKVQSIPAHWAFSLSGYDLDWMRPVDVVGKISPRPMLLIAAAHDNQLPPEATQRVFAAAGQPKELFLLPGEEHVPYPDDGTVPPVRAEIARRLLAFFQRALTPPPAIHQL